MPRRRPPQAKTIANHCGGRCPPTLHPEDGDRDSGRRTPRFGAVNLILKNGHKGGLARVGLRARGSRFGGSGRAGQRRIAPAYMAVPRSREPSPPRPSSESDAPRLHRRLNFGATFPLLPALLLLLSELSEQLLISPRIRLLEASVCRAYYRSHDPSMLDPIDGGIDEQQCKITEVQAQLAHIRGWQVFWEAIPGAWALFAANGGRIELICLVNA